MSIFIISAVTVHVSLLLSLLLHLLLFVLLFTCLSLHLCRCLSHLLPYINTNIATFFNYTQIQKHTFMIVRKWLGF